MSFTFFVGIDIGKETLEVALFKGGEELQVTTVANTMQEIKSLSCPEMTLHQPQFVKS